jgi:hypothetical protein
MSGPGVTGTVIGHALTFSPRSISGHGTGPVLRVMTDTFPPAETRIRISIAWN